MAESADLHMHSRHSDGLRDPVELAHMGRDAGLRAISLTDHDTMHGWPEYADACAEAGVEAIPGVELSSRWGERDAHILGYFVAPGHEALESSLADFRDRRVERAQAIVSRLNDIGVPLPYREVARVAGGGVVGRPHVAEALVQVGLVQRYDDAFRRYIGVGGPAYVPKACFEAADAIGLIHDAGGLAVLAHPGNHYDEGDVSRLADLGLDGVEIIHPRHRPAATARFSAIAARFGLLMTGGSDYHGGSRGEARVGRPRISYELVEKMRERL